MSLENKAGHTAIYDCIDRSGIKLDEFEEKGIKANIMFDEKKADKTDIMLYKHAGLIPFENYRLETNKN